MAEQMFQVRDASGRIRTVMARSSRAAVKAFVKKFDPEPGDVDVKLRGASTCSWERYRLR